MCVIPSATSSMSSAGTCMLPLMLSLESLNNNKTKHIRTIVSTVINRYSKECSLRWILQFSMRLYFSLTSICSP